MLNEFQVGKVWENMLSAEARALYFWNLASQYTRTKQWISGISFFLSSGVAASLFAKAPNAIALMMASLLVALLNAYSITVALDRKIGTMLKLHSIWQGIATDYSNLWNHRDAGDAETKLDEIIKREREPSELAATEGPYKPRLMEKWQNHVLASYHIG